jgi:hypothetical protein
VRPETELISRVVIIKSGVGGSCYEPAHELLHRACGIFHDSP